MFRRMVALPYDEYAQMNMSQQLRQVKQPLDVQFNDLNKEYEQQANITDPYRRMMLQGETLDEMKNLKERMRNLIASNSPKPYRHRASALFDGLESFIRFNERGEIMDSEGKVVPHSHVQDLIQYAVRDRRRDVVPTGWADFMSLLKKHNVPRHMLNRFTLDEMAGKPIGKAPPPFIFATPAARREDLTGTALKRRREIKHVDRDNPFDVLKHDVAHFESPSPKKRRKLPVRTRREPERFAFVKKF